MKTFFKSTPNTQAIGLAFIRIGIGIIFVFHGWAKITGGTEKWLWLGSQMKHFGITFWPLFWGIMATCAEFFGGIFLTAGFATRIAALFMSCVMIVALSYHFSAHDPFATYSHPLSLLIVFIGLIIAGGGAYSLDALDKPKNTGIKN